MTETKTSKKVYSLVDAERLNPTRPVRWRYLRARTLLGDNGARKRRPQPDRDDEVVFEAYDFMRRWDQADKLEDTTATYEARLHLFPRYPGLYFAHKLFTEPESRLSRIALEARLLARQSDEQINEALDLIPEVVPAYEAVYFNVRDRLDNVDYIVRTVLGPIIGIGLRNATEELASKYWCYFSPDFADEVISGMDNGEQQSMNWWLERGKTMLARRYAMSFPFFKIDSFNLPDVLKGFNDLVALHEKALSESAVKTGMEENISALVNSLSWTVGARQQKLVVQGTVAQEFIGQAVEPRASELVELAQGKVPKRLAEHKTKQLPPPRTKKENENAK